MIEAREEEDSDGTLDGEEELERVETEDDCVEVISRFTVDEDTIDWLERLKADGPSLVSMYWEFYVASESQAQNLSIQSFAKRLKTCRHRLGEYTRLPADITKMLFERAISDRQTRDAYEAFKNVLQGGRFNDTHQFIKAELMRVDLISKLIDIHRGPAVPKGLSEWEGVWI